MRFVHSAVIAIIVVVVLSVIYKLLPHRRLSDQKPVIAFFPKYVFPVEEEIAISNLEGIDFKRHKDTKTFVRGYYIGDFLASVARLNVILDKDKAYIRAPLVALFDTGDLWEIAKQVQGSS